MFNSDSISLRILFLIAVMPWLKTNRKKGRPFYHSPTVMSKCFIVSVRSILPSNNILHQYFSLDMVYNKRVMKSCGLYRLPEIE